MYERPCTGIGEARATDLLVFSLRNSLKFQIRWPSVVANRSTTFFPPSNQLTTIILKMVYVLKVWNFFMIRWKKSWQLHASLMTFLQEPVLQPKVHIDKIIKTLQNAVADLAVFIPDVEQSNKNTRLLGTTLQFVPCEIVTKSVWRCEAAAYPPQHA
jgi:hypothetical protein